MAASLARDEEERSQHNPEGESEEKRGIAFDDCCREAQDQNCCGEVSPNSDLPIEDPPLMHSLDHGSCCSCSHEEIKHDENISSQPNQAKIDDDRQLLLRMSLNTAVAIGLHNFPEGLATFVGTLHDPAVGAVLAVAIAIHNIPEGLCVALPIYYATGSRSKAFLGALLSGLSEPLAAVLGYIVLAQVVSYVAYAILFGIVAGMMVMISARELLPTAHRYDPDDRVVSYAFIIGMAVMALSLVLFVI
jgi:zinc transporter ZupT